MKDLRLAARRNFPHDLLFSHFDSPGTSASWLIAVLASSPLLLCCATSFWSDSVGRCSSISGQRYWGAIWRLRSRLLCSSSLAYSSARSSHCFGCCITNGFFSARARGVGVTRLRKSTITTGRAVPFSRNFRCSKGPARST